MEEKKEIKREDFVKVLNTFFPDGYSGDLDAWQTCWFCGWSSIEIEDKWDVALSINVDTKTSIVFDFINSKNTDIKNECVAMYIRGMMRVLLPNMECYDDMGVCNTIVFCYK